MRGFGALLAILAFAGPAGAASCGEALRQPGAIAALTKASEARPVHVQFTTREPGVGLSSRLLEKHPENMTIVLQHHFDMLAIKSDRFEVGLWFNRRHERVVVPFDAVIGMWDNGAELCKAG